MQSPSYPSPCQAPTGHQGNCGWTQGETSRGVIKRRAGAGGRPHFPWKQQSAGQRVGRERNSVPGGREVGRVTSPVSLPPSDAVLNALLPTDVWLLRSGSQSPTFLHRPWLKTRFPHHWKWLLLSDPPRCLPVLAPRPFPGTMMPPQPGRIFLLISKNSAAWIFYSKSLLTSSFCLSPGSRPGALLPPFCLGPSPQS